jgi:hypothetical protein
MEQVLPKVLWFLGAGFLVANLRLIVQYLRFLRLRSSALLVWPGTRPPAFGLFLLMGVVFAIVIAVKLLYWKMDAINIVGEAMMCLYYGYLIPLTVTIRRGFYEDGVWDDNGYMPYQKIGGLSWRETPEGESRQITLLLIPRMKRLARKLSVPQEYYGAARRLLRDKIAGHDIHFTGKALDLGAHDERDDV